MQSPEIQTPVYVGESQNVSGVTMTPEIVSLDGETRLRLVDANGSELLIPAHMLPALANRASFYASNLSRTLDDARRVEHHPSHRHDIVEARLDERKGFTLAQHDPEADGTPYIAWVAERDARPHGWALTMTGIDKVELGFAAWNDIPAQDNLIAMLSDADTCIAIAGITAPTETARMSARVSARALRTARALPGIDLKKARKIITDAGLATHESINQYYAARMRLLTVTSGDKQVPVAVAIQAPDKYLNQRELTKEETREMSWEDRSKLQKQYLDEMREPWLASAKQAFTAAGWRLVDLAIESRGRTRPNVFFATRIDAETWSAVSAAATASARYLEMSRGSKV